MEEQNIRTAIDRHWLASAAGDQVVEHEIYHEDAAVCAYPQSGEVMHGRTSACVFRIRLPVLVRLRLPERVEVAARADFSQVLHRRPGDLRALAPAAGPAKAQGARRVSRR